MSNLTHAGLEPDQFNDEQLATLLKHRDPFAFVVLAHRFAQRLEAILARKFSFIPHEDLRDIVAETIIHAFKTGDRFDPAIAKAITWISVLGHYEALKFLRRHGYLMDTSLDEIADRIADHIEYEHHTATQRPSIQMERLLQQLPPQRAKLIRMHYYDGLSIDQIADLLGITHGGVKASLSRGRQNLRNMLEHKTSEEDSPC